MLPVVDISPLASGDPAARLDVARRIGAACESVGFLHVSGHGVADGAIRDVEDAAGRFFALPEAVKRRTTRPPGRLRGYIPTMPFGRNADGAPATTYEGYNVGAEAAPGDPEIAASGGLYAPNLWPAEPEGFRRAVWAYWSAVDRVSRRLLGAFALALGADEDVFAPMFSKPLSNLSLLRYHARPGTADAPPDDAEGHRDTNAVTLLRPGEVGGLQVLGKDGVYREVAPEPGCFVVNIGDMMERWSGGRFRSTVHRVHPPRHAERRAIAFFAAPDRDATIAPLPGLAATGAAADAAPRRAGEDLAAFVANFDRQTRELQDKRSAAEPGT